MSDNISIYDLTFLDKRMYRCGIEIQEFEKDFINSLIKNAKYCTKGVKIFGDVTDSCNRDVVLYLSEKQIKIFDRIRMRYKNAYDNRNSYHVYAQIIEDYEISLDDYDKETLESFKGKKEDEESKEWIRQIILYR
jgi:Mg2+ and Co2+ transporter CorA